MDAFRNHKILPSDLDIKSYRTVSIFTGKWRVAYFRGRNISVSMPVMVSRDHIIWEKSAITGY